MSIGKVGGIWTRVKADTIFKYVVGEPGLSAMSKNGIKPMTLSTDKVQFGVPLFFLKVHKSHVFVLRSIN